MKIIWTKNAVQDREDIWDYLHAENPKAALEMDRRFTEAASPISQNPKTPKSVRPASFLALAK
ncbi:type II toxin-antitoxin system RelE/ParE family toxin [Pseudomonas sp. A1230]|uniref:type II toxin-antitoxin system RelE/ParE family toxin n=1 Tax=Pseudomonas TaxID=286 RepID=UPI00058A78AA|nr:type II toxin-antitoxin system RelE/ParE family toxin [Pseudomonas fluorescens]CEL26886.1 Plasmid stabilization system protein [Pseudomonas fluorescens]